MFELNPKAMSSHNASSVAKSQQWKKELAKKPSDPIPIPTQDIFKDPRSKMLGGTTVCCDQANCNQAKLETMSEQFFCDPATPFTLISPQSGKEEASVPPAEQYVQAYCPCTVSGGQLVTICCTGRNCDEASKIDEAPLGPPQVKRAKTS